MASGRGLQLTVVNIISNLRHVPCLLLLLIVNVSAQIVQNPKNKLAKMTTEITVVSVYGDPLDGAEIGIDGSQVEKKSPNVFELPEGSYKLKVGLRGFVDWTKTIEIKQSTQKIMICLELGLMWDKRPNGVTVVTKGASSDCTTLVVMPLHCAQTRPATVYTFLGGRRSFENLEPGSYLFTLLAGKRTCLTNRMDVREFELGAILELRLP